MDVLAAADGLAANPDRGLQREWMRDGLPDIYCGLSLLLVSGVGAGLSWATARHSWLFLLFPVLVIGGALTLMWTFFRLKARIADPRVGFVRPRLPLVLRSPWLARGFLVAYVVGSMAVSAVAPPIRRWLSQSAPVADTWWPFLWLVPGFVVFAFMRRRYGTTGHVRVAVVAVLCAILAVRLGLPVDDSVRWVAWPVIGVGHVVIGAFALRSFLQSHPLPASA